MQLQLRSRVVRVSDSWSAHPEFEFCWGFCCYVLKWIIWYSFFTPILAISFWFDIFTVFLSFINFSFKIIYCQFQWLISGVLFHFKLHYFKLLCSYWRCERFFGVCVFFFAALLNCYLTKQISQQDHFVKTK